MDATLLTKGSALGLVLELKVFWNPETRAWREQLGGYQERSAENKMRCRDNRFIFAVLRVKIKAKLSGKVIQK